MARARASLSLAKHYLPFIAALYARMDINMNKFIFPFMLLLLTACNDTKDTHFKKIVSCDLLEANFEYMKDEKAVYEAQRNADVQTTKTAEEFAKLVLDLEVQAAQVEECKSYIKQHGRQ